MLQARNEGAPDLPDGKIPMKRSPEVVERKDKRDAVIKRLWERSSVDDPQHSRVKAFKQPDGTTQFKPARQLYLTQGKVYSDYRDHCFESDTEPCGQTTFFKQK